MLQAVGVLFSSVGTFNFFSARTSSGGFRVAFVLLVTPGDLQGLSSPGEASAIDPDGFCVLGLKEKESGFVCSSRSPVVFPCPLRTVIYPPR